MLSAIIHHAWWHVFSGVLAWSCVAQRGARLVVLVRLIQPAKILIWPRQGQSVSCECLSALSTMCWPPKIKLIWFAVPLWQCLSSMAWDGVSTWGGLEQSAEVLWCGACGSIRAGEWAASGGGSCKQKKLLFPRGAPWFAFCVLLVIC